MCADSRSGVAQTRCRNLRVSTSSMLLYASTAARVPIARWNSLRLSRNRSPYGRKTDISLPPTSSPAIGTRGRSEYLEPFLSSISVANLGEFNMTMCLPGTLTCIMSPVQCSRSNMSIPDKVRCKQHTEFGCPLRKGEPGSHRRHVQHVTYQWKWSGARRQRCRASARNKKLVRQVYCDRSKGYINPSAGDHPG